VPQCQDAPRGPCRRPRPAHPRHGHATVAQLNRHHELPPFASLPALSPRSPCRIALQPHPADTSRKDDAARGLPRGWVSATMRSRRAAAHTGARAPDSSPARRRRRPAAQASATGHRERFS
jgi:hypothetical protein